MPPLIDINRVIAQAHELAPLSPSTVRLTGLLSSPDCHLEDVAELIAFDEGLTASLLRSANSAASASSVPVATVQEAVTRMGTAQVLSMAVASGARPMLKVSMLAYGFGEGALWRHSVASAVAAEAIRNASSIELPAEGFTASILHDVGKLVMGRFISAEIMGCIQRAQLEDHLEWLEAEEQVLGIHHAKLGGMIAQHWKLPPRIVQGITFHHHPDQGGDVICDLTYLANLLGKRIEAGLDGRKVAFTVLPGVEERLGLKPDSIEALCPQATQRYTKVSSRYNS